MKCSEKSRDSGIEERVVLKSGKAGMAVQIGIPIPTTDDASYNSNYWPEYARAVRDSGAEPTSLPIGSIEMVRDAAVGCAGYVLPGSPADVDPALYGRGKDEATASADPAREKLDLWLLEHAAVSGKPVVAICYGLQRLNVWLGGTLVQDLMPIPVNHAAGAAVLAAHSVFVQQQSLLAGLLTASEAPSEGEYRRLMVNSSHHQAIDIPGEGLTVVARSVQDGLIEAVEGRVGRAAIVGVQWHPERSTGVSAASRALFHWLTAEAEDWEGRRQSDFEGNGLD